MHSVLWFYHKSSVLNPFNILLVIYFLVNSSSSMPSWTVVCGLKIHQPSDETLFDKRASLKIALCF